MEMVVAGIPPPFKGAFGTEDAQLSVNGRLEFGMVIVLLALLICANTEAA